MRDLTGASGMCLQRGAISGWIIHFFSLKPNKDAIIDSNHKLFNDGYYYVKSDFPYSCISCPVNLVYEGQGFHLPDFESNFFLNFCLKMCI